MSRYRLRPTPAQEAGLLEHCSHARFMWNLAVEQHAWWTPRRGPAPGYAAVPSPIPAPGYGAAVGVDRGVAVSAALSTGQTSTDLARRFDVIAVEDLDIAGMTRSARGTIDASGTGVRAKAGLNRGILANGWGQLATRLENKAPGHVVRVDPAHTSQTCNACGHRAPGNRESQAVFRCTACGHRANADVNAAHNIKDTAVGRTVAARGGGAAARPVNREPQPALLSV